MPAILAAMVVAFPSAISPAATARSIADVPEAPVSAPPTQDTPRLQLELQLSVLRQQRADVPLALGITLMVASTAMSGGALALIIVGFQQITASPLDFLFFGAAPFLPYLSAAFLLMVAAVVCVVPAFAILNSATTLDSQISSLEAQLSDPPQAPVPLLRF